MLIFNNHQQQKEYGSTCKVFPIRIVIKGHPTNTNIATKKNAVNDILFVNLNNIPQKTIPQIEKRIPIRSIYLK